MALLWLSHVSTWPSKVEPQTKRDDQMCFKRGEGSALIRYPQLLWLLNGMQSEKTGIIALHQHSIHSFRPISMSSMVTCNGHWVLTPKPENHLFIPHHLISWSHWHCLSKCQYATMIGRSINTRIFLCDWIDLPKCVKIGSWDMELLESSFFQSCHKSRLGVGFGNSRRCS